MEFPKDLRYTESHEWVRQDGNTLVIGITAFAVEQLGDITLVELPEVGATLEAEAPCGTIESVKSVSDLYCPVAGSVVAINGELEDSPELVNEEPYGKGWLLSIKPSSADAFESLLDAAAYSALVAEAH